MFTRSNIMAVQCALALGLTACDMGSPAPPPPQTSSTESANQGAQQKTKKPINSSQQQFENDDEGEQTGEVQRASSVAPEETQPQEDVKPQTQPIYRKFASFHLYTKDANEGADKFFVSEGVGFKTYKTKASGTVELYRCKITGAEIAFVSLSNNCEGQTSVGSLGFVYSSQQPGAQPLIRCSNRAADFIVLSNVDDCRKVNFAVDGPLGFAPSN